MAREIGARERQLREQRERRFDEAQKARKQVELAKAAFNKYIGQPNTPEVREQIVGDLIAMSKARPSKASVAKKAAPKPKKKRAKRGRRS